MIAVALAALVALAAPVSVARAQAPTPAPAPGVITPTPASAAPGVPPAQWTRWEVAGTLIDPPERVRAMLEGDMRTRRALTPRAKEEMNEACQRLGYHLVDQIITRPAEGEVVVILKLEPIVVVRWVAIELSQRVYDILLDDEVGRRMRLRPGYALPWDPTARQQFLSDEAGRIEAFLRDEGFFEAAVAIDIDRVGRYGARVQVRAVLGPSYQVGKVTVVNASQTGGDLALSTAEISRQFRHGSVCWLFSRCRFTRARLQADLEVITRRFQRRGYPAVRVQTDFDAKTSFDRRTKRVTFTVAVDPRRKVDVVFEGNDPTVFTDDALAALLTFGAATSADDIEVATSARAIERGYQAKGYLDAVVTSERVRLRAFDRIIYRIEVGPLRLLRSVEFVCRDTTGAVAPCSLPVAALRELVGTRAASKRSVFGGRSRSYPTREQLAADVDGLVRAYRGRGYLAAAVAVAVAPRPSGWASAAVAAAEVAAEVTPKDVHVRFEIDEGPRTVIQRIDIVFKRSPTDGRFASDEAAIRARLTVAAGDPYLQDTLDAQVQALKDWYWSLGRPRAVVTVGPPVPVGDDHHVAITFNIEEKQQLYLGQVVIRGNFRTHEWVIRDQLGFEPGAPLTANLQSGGLRRLRATNLFDSVTFDLIDFDDAGATKVDVVVKVEERNDLWTKVEFEGGYSQLNGLFFRLKPIWPNAFGRGIRIEGGVTLGPEYQSGEASLRIPRWLTKGWFDAEVATFVRNQVTERFGDLTSRGGSLALARTWEQVRDARRDARLVTATVRYDVRERIRNEDTIRTAGPAGTLAQNPIRTRTGTIGASLSWDQRRDDSGDVNPLAPTRGFRVEAGLAVASPLLLGQDTFLKFNALGQAVFTAGRVQLRADGRYDHGVPLGGAVLLPEVERFFAGGDDTVRGFEQDRLATELVAVPVPPLDGGCGPSNPTAAGLCQIRILPAAGNIRAIGSLDAQVTLGKVPRIPFPVASAVFTDAGIVTNTWGSVTVGSIRPSAGMAARLLLPIGAISFEYALPLVPRLGDDPRGRFHFSVALRY